MELDGDYVALPSSEATSPGSKMDRRRGCGTSKWIKPRPWLLLTTLCLVVSTPGTQGRMKDLSINWRDRAQVQASLEDAKQGKFFALRGKRSLSYDPLDFSIEPRPGRSMEIEHLLRGRKDSFNHLMRGKKSELNHLLRGKKSEMDHLLRGRRSEVDHLLRGRRSELEHLLRGRRSELEHLLRGKKSTLADGDFERLPRSGDMNHLLRGKKSRDYDQLYDLIPDEALAQYN